ncbi:hypothetical protein LTR84_006691 [Exophiala bonariae]|uniref:Cytochrome P450 monooxygenase n=1 Tax=Exophiala bonariae TaxID=1690606 RepID=A0AAV9N0U4_9EURO|nr:hypothetical protein LTR84_006691 [Exophiala bonariae]
MSNLWNIEMNKQNSNTKCFEVLDWLNRTTLDIIGRAGLGTDIDSLTNPEAPLRDAYRRCFEFDIQARVINGLAAFTPLVRLLPVRANRDMAKARSIILDHATRIIYNKASTEEESSKVHHKDIIGLIVKNNLTASKEDFLTVETMRDQVMTFLGAGHDTTATTAAWTLLLLAKNPEIQGRLRNEIRSHMPFLFDADTREDVSKVNHADVDLLPYLEDVCKESLRYIPSIPMTVRKTIEDDTLGGYFVPGGTTIYLMANCINRLPTYWGDTANTFDPTRWKNLPDTYTTNAFMTFLQGPRGCVGRKFAEVEMKTILCALLSKYTFELDANVQDPEELKMWRLVLRPRDGVSLKVSLLN